MSDATVVEGAESRAPDPHALDERHAEVVAAFTAALGEAVVESAANFGIPVVRIAPSAWRRAAEVLRFQLGGDYLSFVAGLDWMPAPVIGGDGGGSDTSAPVQPQAVTYGAAGSAGRFQVFAQVQSTARHWSLTLKTDVAEDDFALESWVAVYPGADWHERECWEMFGIAFTGHPALRHLYLPSEFEGNPLRKDFPLLSRVVKPWPGLVDVEAMPGEGDDEAAAGDAPAEGAAETPA